MAKKFGKFLLFTAATAAACAGVYYYLQNKEKFSANYNGDEDDDYDDFSDDLDDADSNRSYVSLTPENNTPKEQASSQEEAPFEKLSSLVSNAADKAEEKVEEFFDEDEDDSAEE